MDLSTPQSHLLLLVMIWDTLYIVNRENPQNYEPQNGPRRGLDFIALYAIRVLNWINEPNQKFSKADCQVKVQEKIRHPKIRRMAALYEL